MKTSSKDFIGLNHRYPVTSQSNNRVSQIYHGQSSNRMANSEPSHALSQSSTGSKFPIGKLTARYRWLKSDKIFQTFGMGKFRNRLSLSLCLSLSLFLSSSSSFSSSFVFFFILLSFFLKTKRRKPRPL